MLKKPTHRIITMIIDILRGRLVDFLRSNTALKLRSDLQDIWCLNSKGHF